MNWTTPNRIIPTSADHAIELREFRPGPNPTLILPPQAGHGGEVADWPAEGQSLVRSVLDNTEGGVYLIDWRSCTYERRHETYADLVSQVRAAVEVCGPARVIGLCQGGTLATIYTALHPEDVTHLVAMGCPLDAHAGEGALTPATRIPLRWYQMAVAMQGGLVRGDWMLANWKALNWTDHYLNRYLEPSERKELFYSWYDSTQDIAGGWYLELVEQLFLQNRLIDNQLTVGGKTVDLTAITCRTDLVGGEKDNITPRKQTFALTCHVPHATTYTIPGAGHIGVFMSQTTCQEVLPMILRP